MKVNKSKVLFFLRRHLRELDLDADALKAYEVPADEPEVAAKKAKLMQEADAECAVVRETVNYLVEKMPEDFSVGEEL